MEKTKTSLTHQRCLKLTALSFIYDICITKLVRFLFMTFLKHTRVLSRSIKTRSRLYLETKFVHLYTWIRVINQQCFQSLCFFFLSLFRKNKLQSFSKDKCGFLFFHFTLNLLHLILEFSAFIFSEKTRVKIKKVSLKESLTNESLKAVDIFHRQ